MRVGIVGCSINGAYLAYRLAKQGHDVTVFEEKSEIGGKPCSGLVSERIWDFLPKNERIVLNRVSEVEIRFPKKKVRISFRPEMLVVDRNLLDSYAAKLAAAAGAKIKLGHKAVKIISLGGSKPHLVAESGGRTHVQEFDRIIGCDGANSRIRGHLKAKKPLFRFGMYVVLKKKNRKNIVEVSPTENGFKWRIPRGETIEAGAIERPDKIKKIFRRAKALRRFSAIIPEGLCVSKDRRFALCGDAAGLAKPWSGGGIIWGLTAANLLAASKLNVAKYNRKLERHFGPKIFFSKLARKAVYLAGTKAPWLLPRNVFIDSDWLF